MNCPKCGTQNIAGSSFCIRCGSNLLENQPVSVSSSNQPAIAQSQTIEKNETTTPTQVYTNEQLNLNNQKVNEVISEQVNPSIEQLVKANDIKTPSNKPLNYLMYIIIVLLKPFTCFKEEEEKLDNTKTALLFASILSVGMMLITLIKSMISVIFAKTLDYSTYTYKTSIDFGNLKNLDWLSLIGKNLLIYAGIIFGLAAIYYLATLIFKKTVSYIKLLSISTTCIIPFVVSTMIVSPIIGKIWSPLGVIFALAGIIYSVLIFVCIFNEHVVLESTDKKIYLHLICLTILGVAGYYLYMNLAFGSVESQISSIFDLLK